VLPPYLAVWGPGVGIEPRVPQNVRAYDTVSDRLRDATCPNLFPSQARSSGRSHRIVVTALTRRAAPPA
jgi:hypothetical protein